MLYFKKWYMYLCRLFPFLFLLLLSQCFRFEEHNTNQCVYPPFNWYWHIQVDPINFIYPWTYMTINLLCSVGQTNLSSFLLRPPHKKKKQPGIFLHKASLSSKIRPFVYIKNSNSITSSLQEQQLLQLPIYKNPLATSDL